MAEYPLTYRASGVDVEANNEANARIASWVRSTYNERVLTSPGLFAGALSLRGLSPASGSLVGALGGSEESEPPALAAGIVETCRAKLGRSVRPLAFLDYIAASPLEPLRAAELVGAFCRLLSGEPRIPLIGGETAEMPGVFLEKSWEVIGALFALEEAAAPAGQAARAPAEAPAAGRPSAGLHRAAGFAHPALVFSMDGVGTKTKVGLMAGRTSGLALDLIHHSLNDILCQGAEGLAVLLYLGCRSRDERLIEPIIRSAESGCRAAGLQILELVVAEKPDLYRPGEIDLCGAIAGVVDEESLIQGSAVQAGDRLIGLTSSGLHTNGFSLARMALLERGQLELDRRLPQLGCTLAEALLAPHRNYAPAVLPLLRDPGLAGAVRGIAHITGGGLQDNLARILTPGLAAEIRLGSWRPPAIFELIRRAGGIPLQDGVGKGMYETFNMGIGLVLACVPEAVEEVLRRLRGAGQEALPIGQVLRSGAAAAAGGATGKAPAAQEAQERVRLLP